MVDCITHCIFDVDGLILNTEIIYYAVLEEIANDFGKHFSQQIQSEMMGSPTETAMTLFVQRIGVDEIYYPSIMQKFKNLLSERLPDCNLIKGVERLVYHLHANNIPLGIATGSDRYSFEMKTKNHKKFFNYFAVQMLSDNIKLNRPKPYPDIYELAMQKFGSPDINPRNVLVFEDSLAGVQAAAAAKMHVIMVPSLPLNIIESKLPSGIDIISSLESFKPEQYGLPPFPKVT
ncbi:hypothetical protein GJ496_004779 [Pomphorhynchus laevis]|nr:hypothetical protein GJ496_004779 [Pomphorhynchus laevis]